jgi:hypothetical protein
MSARQDYGSVRGDMNFRFLTTAIQLKAECTFIPRRSATIKGIPFNVETDTWRIYIKLHDGACQSILMGDVGSYVWPAKVVDSTDTKKPLGKPFSDYGPPEERSVKNPTEKLIKETKSKS